MAWLTGPGSYDLPRTVLTMAKSGSTAASPVSTICLRQRDQANRRLPPFDRREPGGPAEPRRLGRQIQAGQGGRVVGFDGFVRVHGVGLVEIRRDFGDEILLESRVHEPGKSVADRAKAPNGRAAAQ